MSKLLMVAMGGAAGAVARYWLAGLINARLPMYFPLGTFIVNVSGSFILGFFMTLADDRFPPNSHWRLLIAVGFIGAYTTFSTFEYETLKLLETGSVLKAALNVSLSVAVGFLAVWLGVISARRCCITTEISASSQQTARQFSGAPTKPGN